MRKRVGKCTVRPERVFLGRVGCGVGDENKLLSPLLVVGCIGEGVCNVDEGQLGSFIGQALLEPESMRKYAGFSVSRNGGLTVTHDNGESLIRA